MNEQIVLHNNTVILMTENGLAKWMFEEVKDAKLLYDLLVLSNEVDEMISKLITKSD